MAGLGAAETLIQRGLRTTVVEAAPSVGGLARAIRVNGEPIEAYYHHIFPQDRATRELIDAVGLSDRLEWRPASMATLHEARVFPFNGPLDLLRFRPLSLPARLHLAAGMTAQLVRRDARRLDRSSVGRSGPRWFGRRGYDILWRPLLEAKFGAYAPDVAMAWLVARIRQRAGGRRLTGDRLGYLRGSLGTLAEAYGERVRSAGVEILTGTRVARLCQEGLGWRVDLEGPSGVRTQTADVIVACLSGPVLSRLVDLPSGYREVIDSVPYRGVVCALLELDRSLSPYYWTNVTDRLGLGCVGIIEHTNFIPPDRYGGRHLVYLAHYVDRDGPTWRASTEELIEAAFPSFRALNPAFEPGWIRDAHVSRDPFAQPVPLIGGPMPNLPIATGLPGLFHASLAHVYPDDRGVSLAIGLGRRAANLAVASISG